MNAVILAVRIVVVQKFLEHILSEILSAYSDRSFLLFAHRREGARRPPL